MKIAIVYDSSTGTTESAAQAMGKTLEEHGHQCQVLSVRQANPDDVADADLICIGTWVRGLFIIRQHPNPRSMQFISKLGDLAGKNAVVFCTYKLAAGRTLPTMAQALQGKGATVIGRFKFRGPEPDRSFASFAASIR